MKDNNINKKLIIGDSKITMSDSDFIELCTRLGNDINGCVCEDNSCIDGCSSCWAKYLSNFIEV
ncbi:Uncharacterised protein [Clostridium baratii]|uniref:hypothetical protein n=1 Tax=Clostridium baratii TaxID=1561 RepID=UPI0006C4638F|nr:hypothetical protein [Clostridium baratii]CUO91346.1 Uncharacterised protein [Clostridium baratii]